MDADGMDEEEKEGREWGQWKENLKNKNWP